LQSLIEGCFPTGLVIPKTLKVDIIVRVIATPLQQ